MIVTHAVAIATILVAFVSAAPPEPCPIHNEQYPVILPNPDNPATFYICNEGTPFLMNCTAGLLFNPELKVCDWPKNVNLPEESVNGLETMNK